MMTDKAALRAAYLAARVALSPADKQRTDEAIARNVLQSACYQRAKTIFVYVATADEIETRTILADALAQQKTVCVPRCQKAGVMTARQIGSLGDLVCSGWQGILEPPETAPIVPPDAIDLCLVPALACDGTGTRLGYGGGYYDRYLAKTAACRAAVCAESRLVDALPREPHDMRCHLIVTERRVVRTDET